MNLEHEVSPLLQITQVIKKMLKSDQEFVLWRVCRSTEPVSLPRTNMAVLGLG
jgi:hypothetical protein